MAFLAFPIAVGTTFWMPAHMGCASDAWFVKPEFNLMVPILFRAALQTSLRWNRRLYHYGAAIIMLSSTIMRLIYGHAISHSQTTDKGTVESYLRVSLASFIAILLIEGCTLYRVLKNLYNTLNHSQKQMHNNGFNAWSVLHVLMTLNSFYVLLSISHRVVSILASLNNDMWLYVYWLLAAASSVSRVFVQGTPLRACLFSGGHKVAYFM